MIGTRPIPKTRIESIHATLVQAQAIMKNEYLGREVFKSFGFDVEAVTGALKSIDRVFELSEQFPPIMRDPEIRRKVQSKSRFGDSPIVEIPLVFYAELPAQNITRQLVFAMNGGQVQVSAVTPVPTEKALQMIKEHKSKFDKLEIWWVPNDILVEKLPDPDPVLVGRIDVKHVGSIYFELCRWVDESVESGYWSREGY